MHSFDWNKIRALEGSQAHGFEELCAQLARAEIPQGARFDRKGSPDAGVECFSRLCDGGEWGGRRNISTYSAIRSGRNSMAP